MSSGKRGPGAGHKTSAATGPGLDGGFNSRHRVGFSGSCPTLTINIKGQGTCLGVHDAPGFPPLSAGSLEMYV